LNSNYALITANGFYFSETYGALSMAPITLQAFTDLTDNESVNVNVMTHIIKGRIENLLSDGMSFQAANAQAKAEFLTFLGVSGAVDSEFEDLDISVNTDENAILLAFSIALQRNTAALTELLAHLSNDFAPDGEINDQGLINSVVDRIKNYNFADIRDNIEERYSELGQSVIIPNFEHYLNEFREQWDPNIVTSFQYPAMAPPVQNYPNSLLLNLLDPAVTEYELPNANSVAAITPFNKNLTIKFITNNANYSTSGPDGWEFINNHPNGFTLIAQKQNALMTMLLNFWDVGSGTIEYYEDDAVSPTYTKEITWN